MNGLNYGFLTTINLISPLRRMGILLAYYKVDTKFCVSVSNQSVCLCTRSHSKEEAYSFIVCYSDIRESFWKYLEEIFSKNVLDFLKYFFRIFVQTVLLFHDSLHPCVVLEAYSFEIRYRFIKDWFGEDFEAIFLKFGLDY